MDLKLTVEIFQENGMYIAYVPQLDVSSGGKTVEEARRSIRDAVGGFLEAAKHAGTVEQILEESGFVRGSHGWRGPDLVSVERLTLSQPA